MAPVEPLHIKLLGGFEATGAQGRAVEIAARKTRALLAYLALAAGRSQGRDKLANLLWSDRGDKQARDSLRQALTELREALANLSPLPLATPHDTVSLDRPAVDVDALEFERLARSNGADDLRRAATLYGGDLLDGIGVKDPVFDEWLAGARRHYRELAISVLKKLLAHERGEAAVVVAQQLLVLDPLQEEGHRALMRAHADAGDIAMALRQYETCRDILKRDLDVAPSPQTEALLQQIKDQSTAQPVRDLAADAATDASQRLPVSMSKPSVAILPFKNLSGDPGQQYFSDGTTEDIITELSRFHSLFVIAHSSSLLFRDKAADTKQIGRELGAEYVVEGSIRRMGTRLRVTAQLSETATGNSLWAERYDRDVEEIFEVQDEVVRAIVAVLPGRIEEARARSARRKRPENLTAYDYYLRAVEHSRQHEVTDDQADETLARKWYEKAIALDPNLGIAYSCMGVLPFRAWFRDLSARDLEKAISLCRKGAHLDPSNSRCQGILGAVLLYAKQLEEAAFQLEQALTLNPNDTIMMIFMAWLLTYRGRPREALEWLDKAFRLNPYPPPWLQCSKGMALYASGRYAEALTTLRSDLSIWELMYLVACYGQLDRVHEARVAIGEFRSQHPGKSLLQFAAVEPYERTADLDRLMEGLRKAGVLDVNG